MTADAGKDLFSHSSFPLRGQVIGQDYGVDSMKCTDAVAKMIDTETKDAGLL